MRPHFSVLAKRWWRRRDKFVSVISFFLIATASALFLAVE
jgi:hypothetical protein